MSRVTVCFKHGCKLQKPVTFFGVDVRERNHRQLRWTLTYWGVSKTQTIPGWNGIENAIIKKNNSLPNGTLMVDSPSWKLKNRLKQTPQETRESHTQLHTACFVFFCFPYRNAEQPLKLQWLQGQWHLWKLSRLEMLGCSAGNFDKTLESLGGELYKSIPMEILGSLHGMFCWYWM